MKCSLCFLTLLLTVCWHPSVPATVGDARALQGQAIQRLERYMDHFRRTFDRSSLRSELVRAERELEQSVALFQRSGLLQGAAHSLVKLGDSRRYRDDWDAAIDVYREAARVARRAQAPAVECKALMGHARALLYGKRAPGPALELVDQALPLATKVDDRSYMFDALDLLAQIQVHQGDLVGAADSLNRAFAVEDAVKDEKLLYYGYLDRADLYQKYAEKCDYQRDFRPCLDAVERARRDYRQALSLARKLRWDGLAEQTEAFIQRLGMREQMIYEQQRMHELMSASGLFSPREAGDVVVSKRFAAGENPQLVGLFAWLESQGGLPLSTDARGAYIRGLLNEAAGKYDEAIESYLRATDLLEDDRRFLYDERARGAYVEDKVEFYYMAILHLLDARRYDEAFQLMERSRSRVMSDLIATRNIALSSPRERSLYAEMLKLRVEIAQYQACMFTLSGAKRTDPDCEALINRNPGGENAERGAVPVDEPDASPAPSASELQAALDSLQTRYAFVRDRMTRETPRLARLVTSAPVALGALQAALKRDRSELIAYLSLESQIVIWHIGHDSVHVRSVFLPRSALKQKIQRLRNSLVDPKRPYDDEVAHELYLYLITPVSEWIKTDHLVIIPHEDLHYLPFQALLANPDDGFFGEDYRITYAPSATVLVSLERSAPLAQPRLLAVADPSLQHAPREVRAIGTRYSGRIVDEALPREADVKSWMPDHGLVHLAVHGSFVSGEPLLSYLHFEAGGGDDGRLTAAEMYGLALDAAKLVVLSACETGTVRATHANEVIGMMRGLIFAGADALLLSAWKIDDEATAEWMQVFYATATSKPPAEPACTTTCSA